MVNSHGSWLSGCLLSCVLLLGACGIGGADEEGCFMDRDCPGEAPHCIGGGLCVECTSEFKHCSDGLVCDSVNKVCTECRVYEDCLYRYGFLHKCDKGSGRCVLIKK